MDFELLHRIAKATLAHASDALDAGLRLDEALGRIAETALGEWQKVRPNRAERERECNRLTKVNPSELRQLILQIAEMAEPNLRDPLSRFLESTAHQMRRVQTVGTTANTVRFDTAATLIALLPGRVPLFRAGQRLAELDGIVLDELLGMGGFGEVWKAHRPARPTEGVVALKFCLAQRDQVLKHEGMLNQVLRRQGDHPGIVRLQKNHAKTRFPCLEYEFVEGGDLSALINAWAVEPPKDLVAQSTRLMHELADIVEFAHRSGIVHRDLKPANILMQPGPEGPTLRVTDFGIGGLAAAATLLLTTTQRSALLVTALRGTATGLYASPEQQQGAEPDPRDDVYALGVIWYQMLTRNLKRGQEEGWEEDLSEEGVPEATIELIKGCTRRKRENRLADATALTERLSRLLPPGKKPRRMPTPPREVVNSIGMKFAWCPPGTFLMGRPATEEGPYDEVPQHRVTMTKGFYLGVYQVTQAQWQSVMGSNPSHFKGENRPVEQVSWEDCQEFCKKLGERDGKTYRLPTEAEWEYACRAGTTTEYHSGNGLDALRKVGWFDENSGSETKPVGQLIPNAWGLYDMHGNVWEWCLDGVRQYQKGDIKDPFGPQNAGNTRVLRGGSWNYGFALRCRAAFRNNGAPSRRNGDVGCRVLLCLD